MKRFTFTVAAVLLTLELHALDDPLACKNRPDMVGPCHLVHARLMAYNGTPSFRIWVIGTHRLLGITEVEFGDDPERPLMPEDLREMSEGTSSELYGEFEVCPMSHPKPHEMQSVCLESAKHIIKKPYGSMRHQGSER